MDGQPNGQGAQYFLADDELKGDIYVGEFRDGDFNGQGTFTFTNGNKYVGDFRNDNFNGQGTKTYADGTIEEGIWKDDKFQYAQKVTPPVITRKSQ